jgi:hypothetical protein
MNDNFNGTIIEESLEEVSVLKKVKILKTKIEKVVKEHKTPWIEQWTMHAVEISKAEVEEIADQISKSLDSEHDWYADFKNDLVHYIIFKNKVFKINRQSKEGYDKATKYGISLGIPDYQVDFSPHIKKWNQN